MVLWFCSGTAGELIKLYPLIRLAEERGLPWFALSTGQSAVNYWKQWDDFRLPRSRCGSLISTQADLRTSGEALKWFARATTISASKLARKVVELSGHLPQPSDAWIVHGDTLSTLVGAWYARKLGVPLAHVEAGLRSSHLFKPFPEEINRRCVSRFARFHFPQDELATKNLEKARVSGKVICTGGNTLIDALERIEQEFEVPKDMPNEPYVVANIHRFENLNSGQRWNQTIEVLAQAARTRKVCLVLHPPTEAKLEAEPESRRRLLDAGVELLPRQPFSRFVHYLSGSDYVISDGGSNQEECFYLGKPCLILRESTERIEGLEGPCLLTRFDPTAIDRFLKDPESFRGPRIQFAESPSSLILRGLESG